MSDNSAKTSGQGTLNEAGIWTRKMSRRDFLVTAGLTAGALSAGGLVAACGGGGSSASSSASANASAAALSRGGTLRAGIIGLATSDSRDPAAATTPGGYALARQLYDSLMVYGPDGKLQPSLAQEVTPVSASEWVVRLRDAQWHDGKPVTADDVMYTFGRILNPKKPMPNASAIAFIDLKRMKKEDAKTVRFHLLYPTVTFADAMASPLQSIVPVGFDPKNPIGSGAFTLDQFTPGQRYTFKRFDSYWITQQPYVDDLAIIGFQDSSSEANALIGGQIDVASALDASLVRVVEAAGDNLTVFESPSSDTLCWVMNCEKPPFDNVNVRQALRLAVDRAGIVEHVYDRHAAIGNDLFDTFDPCYAHAIAQHENDPEQALALLKHAGYDRVEVQLTGAPIAATANAQNEALVSQVKPGGFDINFRQVDVATFYGSSYGTYPLSLSLWGELDILDQAALTVTKGSPYNSSHWSDSGFDRLFKEASAEPDQTKRSAIMYEMQKIEWDTGSYVVAQFENALTGYSTKVGGYVPAPMGEPASDYGFREMGFRSA